MKVPKKLQREWDQRLAASKFDDIEQETREGERELKQYAANAFRGAHPTEIEARRDYFLQCSAFCQRVRFKNLDEARIMELYCEGIPKEEIRKELRLHRTTVYGVIRKYLILFGMHGK